MWLDFTEDSTDSTSEKSFFGFLRVNQQKDEDLLYNMYIYIL